VVGYTDMLVARNFAVPPLSAGVTLAIAPGSVVAPASYPNRDLILEIADAAVPGDEQPQCVLPKFAIPAYTARMKIMLAILSVFSVLAVLPSTTKTFADGKVLRHGVLFKFKDTATPGQIKQVEDAFRALPAQIPQVKTFEWGTNVSPENLAQGFTHCFLLSFSSDKDRDAYLVAPAHKVFGQLLTPYLDKVTVVDFWAQY
jgi:Stress responsive A/B Barrel Domain